MTKHKDVLSFFFLFTEVRMKSYLLKDRKVFEYQGQVYTFPASMSWQECMDALLRRLKLK
jgi:hypothetical protein